MGNELFKHRIILNEALDPRPLVIHLGHDLFEPRPLFSNQKFFMHPDIIEKHLIKTVNTGANFEGNLTFPFAGFVGGANLANIDRISLGFESGRSGDVSIGSLITVPEPASAGLAVLSGLGLLLRRRRS